MMLWDIIRDFFVRFVFGGMDSNFDYYHGMVGSYMINDPWQDGDYVYDFIIDYSNTNSLYVGVGNIFDTGTEAFGPGYYSLGDWLSTTATIITLIGLFIGITIFIIKLVKWISNTIAMR